MSELKRKIEMALGSRFRESQQHPAHYSLCTSNGWTRERCACGALVVYSPNRHGHGRNRVCSETGYHLGWYPTAG